MIKNIFFLLLTISLCTFLIAPAAYACDALGCLFGGHKQDTLILGEVVAVSGDLRGVKIIFVFPQNTISSLKEREIIDVRNFKNPVNLTDQEAQMITVGKKFVMSLNKTGNFYIPAWGVYAVTGTTYSDAQLIKNTTDEDAALQIFINSGGIEKDFWFTTEKGVNKAYMSKDGSDIEIYPKHRMK